MAKKVAVPPKWGPIGVRSDIKSQIKTCVLVSMALQSLRIAVVPVIAVVLV